MNMNHTAILKRIFSVAVPLLLATACITERTAEVETREEFVEHYRVIKGAPDWVNRGSRLLFGVNDTRLFHGVAYASPMGDMALQKSVADDMARAEVARILTAFVETVYADYMASGRRVKGGEKSLEVKDASVLQQIKAISNASEPAIRISGSWRDLKSYDVWTIAELDLKQAKSVIAALGYINADFKLHLEMNADDIFDRIIRERNNVRRSRSDDAE
jgi:hypothetical protein